MPGDVPPFAAEIIRARVAELRAQIRAHRGRPPLLMETRLQEAEEILARVEGRIVVLKPKRAVCGDQLAEESEC